MAENGNSFNGNSFRDTLSHQIHTHPVSDLEDVLRMIRQGKLTGSITIHYSQGTPSGTVEWREKVKRTPPSSSIPSTSPMLSLVRDRS